jgi:hypothetical protein
MSSGDSTWASIEKIFKATMPSNQIVAIDIIQNINLWRRYQVEQEQLH